jgi:DNA mismatch repair ATPase MutS
VPARAFRASVAAGVYTHFTREEDAEMRRGRLDEELSRLEGIVGAVRPGSLLLLNESFASTNEREGSELATGIVRALTEAGVRIGFVTHLSQFARELHDEGRPGALFLRAERLPDGTRTFRMVEGAPLRTSHGADLMGAGVGEGAASGGVPVASGD